MLKACMIGCSLLLAVAGSALAQGDVTSGEKIFKRCATCHVANAPTNRVGPSLHGVFGRTAGSVEGFKYSEAMVQHGQAGLVWTPETVDQYLTDPKAFIPKNKMAFPGLKTPEERADVIAYLEQVTKQ
jgi:cytochrome c